jgi:hypothetical protein
MGKPHGSRYGELGGRAVAEIGLDAGRAGGGVGAGARTPRRIAAIAGGIDLEMDMAAIRRAAALPLRLEVGDGQRDLDALFGIAPRPIVASSPGVATAIADAPPPAAPAPVDSRKSSAAAMLPDLIFQLAGSM